MNGKEYSIGKSFVKIQRNPDKYVSENLITKLKEKDPLWRLGLTERKTLKKLDRCFDFYKEYEYWPKQCEQNRNYPLDDGDGEGAETFDIGTFWRSVKAGQTSISDIYYKKIIQLDSTFVINKKRKRKD